MTLSTKTFGIYKILRTVRTSLKIFLENLRENCVSGETRMRTEQSLQEEHVTYVWLTLVLLQSKLHY